MNSSALYLEAHAHGVIDDVELLTLLSGPYLNDVWIGAQRIAAAEGHELQSKQPRAEDVHYIKRALDDRIAQAYNQGGANSHLAKALEKVRAELTERLYVIVPKYREADELYAKELGAFELSAGGAT
jgi:hypothetical protein